MKKKRIIVSGYFNPIHKGHIEYFKLAKKRGNYLIVIVNNDFQRKLKKSKEFMMEEERFLIVKELKIVDKVILSIDKDKSVSKTLEKISLDLSEEYDLYFANGGDQNIKSIPETKICNKRDIKMLFGLGEKIQSSSWLLKK